MDEMLISKRLALVAGRIPLNEEKDKDTDYRFANTVTIPIDSEFELFVSDVFFKNSYLPHVYGKYSRTRREEEFAELFLFFFRKIPPSTWHDKVKSADVLDALSYFGHKCDLRLKTFDQIYSFWHMLKLVNTLVPEPSFSFFLNFFNLVDFLLISDNSDDVPRELKKKLPLFVPSNPFSLSRTFIASSEIQIDRLIELRYKIVYGNLLDAHYLLEKFFQNPLPVRRMDVDPSYFFDKLQLLNLIADELTQELLSFWILHYAAIRKIKKATPCTPLNLRCFSEKERKS